MRAGLGDGAEVTAEALNVAGGGSDEPALVGELLHRHHELVAPARALAVGDDERGTILGRGDEGVARLDVGTAVTRHADVPAFDVGLGAVTASGGRGRNGGGAHLAGLLAVESARSRGRDGLFCGRRTGHT